MAAILQTIYLNENTCIWISIKISLKFVPKCPINNIPALVQVMAWRRPGDKPSSEPMMASLLTHICSSRSQWVNMKMSYHYRKSHCGDKLTIRLSYLHNGISYTGKTASLPILDQPPDLLTNRRQAQNINPMNSYWFLFTYEQFKQVQILFLLQQLLWLGVWSILASFDDYFPGENETNILSNQESEFINGE